MDKMVIKKLATLALAGIAYLVSGCATPPPVPPPTPKPAAAQPGTAALGKFKEGLASVDDFVEEFSERGFRNNLTSVYVNTSIHGRDISPGEGFELSCGTIKIFHSSEGTFAGYIPTVFDKYDKRRRWREITDCIFYKTPGDMALVFHNGLLGVKLRKEGPFDEAFEKAGIFWPQDLDPRVERNLARAIVARLTSYGAADTPDDVPTVVKMRLNRLMSEGLLAYSPGSESGIIKPAAEALDRRYEALLSEKSFSELTSHRISGI